MDKEELKQFIGKLVVYWIVDDRNEVYAHKGILLKVNDDTATFETKRNVFIVKLKTIQQIKVHINDYYQSGRLR